MPRRPAELISDHPHYRTESGRKMDAVEVSQRYITTHDRTSMCNLHLNERMIAPLWAKVSSTPFTAVAKMREGYGRRIKKSYISPDAPTDSILNPEKVRQPTTRMDERVACVTRIPAHQDPMLPSQVLPAGESLHNIKSRTILSHTRFRTFPHDKRTFLDPLVTERGDDAPIQWGPIKKPIILDS
jgi:hypothetical protein